MKRIALILLQCLWLSFVSVAAVEHSNACFFDIRTQRPQSELINIAITVDQSGIEQLRISPRDYVRGNLQFNSCPIITNVLIRLKGHARFRSIDEDPNITVQLGPTQRVTGLSKFHLNNSVSDGTFMSEVLGAIIADKLGVPTPAAQLCRLRLNKKDLGIHVLVEAITPEFLNRTFNSADGALWEGEYKDVDEPLNTEGPVTQSSRSLAELAKVVVQGNKSNRLHQLAGVLDLDAFYSFMAFETLVRHADGYCNAHNNYRLYLVPEQKTFRFIPHGMDRLFTTPGSAPFVGRRGGLVARAVLENEQGRTAYLNRLLRSLEKVPPDIIDGIIDALGKLIEPTLSVEARKTHKVAVAALKKNMHVHLQAVRNELTSAPN